VPRVLEKIAIGAIAGLAGAAAMDAYDTLIRLAAEGQDQDVDATLKMARAISMTTFHHELTGADERWTAPALHYLLGAALGVSYTIMAERIAAMATGAGTAYGAVIWLLGDEIAVHAMGFAHGRAETSVSARANALASHILYGLTTELTRRLLAM
jgi:putative membrane protein